MRGGGQCGQFSHVDDAAQNRTLEKDAILLAAFNASSTSSSLVYSRATSPKSRASCAEIMSPVNTMSMALLFPTERMSRCVPPQPGSTPMWSKRHE